MATARKPHTRKAVVGSTGRGGVSISTKKEGAVGTHARKAKTHAGARPKGGARSRKPKKYVA